MLLEFPAQVSEIIMLRTHNFGIGGGDDGVGGKDEVQGEHGRARQTQREKARPTLGHQRVDHLLRETSSSSTTIISMLHLNPRSIVKVVMGAMQELSSLLILSSSFSLKIVLKIIFSQND